MGLGAVVLGLGLWMGSWAFAQDAGDFNGFAPVASPTPTATPASPHTSDKWHHFVKETFSPLTLAAGAFNGALSQATNSDPRYGLGSGALAERFGASTADLVTQNFFGDFVMASALHENVIYARKGPAYGGIWKRTGYAISRAFVTRADRGGNTFNWSNLTGTAMSAGFSELYYPPGSRSGGAVAFRFGTTLVGSGFANLFPEFWPDFRAMLQRRRLFRHGH